MLKRLVLASLIVLSACGNANDAGVRTGGTQSSCTTRTSFDLGGPISMINQDGQAITQDDFKGRHALVFFGFTNCPDVCPFTLNRIYTVIDALPDDVEHPLTVMISIDPERDTPELLKTYIGNNGFPEDIVGLTGSAEQVDAAAKAFKAHYGRIDDPTSAAGYTMDHSALIYLMDDNWKFETFFMPDESPDDMAQCLAGFLPKS